MKLDARLFHGPKAKSFQFGSLFLVLCSLYLSLNAVVLFPHEKGKTTQILKHQEQRTGFDQASWI